MRPPDYINQIPFNRNPSSPEEEAFMMLRTKQISEQEYYILNATFSAEKIHQHAPKIYQPLPHQLEDYCIRRTRGDQDWDENLGKRLGVWIQNTFILAQDNKFNYEHLKWAHDKCTEAKLLKHIAILQSGMAAIVGNPFPGDQYKLALRVQALDASDRQARDR